MKVAVIGEVAIQPMIKRTPVPEFPQSMTLSGSLNPPTPTPSMVQCPIPCCSTVAPKARIAFAVSKTSCPSSKPKTSVRPTLSAPKIKDRCEIDLSPGTCASPLRGPHLCEIIGIGAPCEDIIRFPFLFAPVIAQPKGGVYGMIAIEASKKGSWAIKPFIACFDCLNFRMIFTASGPFKHLRAGIIDAAKYDSHKTPLARMML